MPLFDDLASMGMDLNVPAQERQEANREVLKTAISSGMLDLPDEDQVVEAMPYLIKSSPLQPFYKQQAYRVTGDGGAKHSILYLNEYGIVDNSKSGSRYLEKGSIGGFRFLKDMVLGTDIMQCIIGTRARQVSWFLVPERDEGSPGFRFEREDEEKITDDDKKELKALQSFLMDSGDIHDPCLRDKAKRSDFEGFISKLVWDSLAADACPIELVRTNGGKLTGYHNLDYETIRLCSESGYEGDDEIRAVQLMDNTPAYSFGYEDILYEIRNPRTDIRSGGYGWAEGEGIVRAITGYLNAAVYNESGISRSALPRGFVTVFGEYDQRQQTAFEKGMKDMCGGAANRHTVPTMYSKSKEGGVTWTPIDNFNDMFFARYLTLLVSISCARMGINPEEIHFDTFSTRSSALGGKGDMSERLSHSYDKGFVPLLRFVEKVVNRIVALRTKKYRFKFVGVDQEDQDKKHERIKLSSSWDELREIDGREPDENPIIGKAPAGNPAMMGLYNQLIQAQLQPQQPAGGDQGRPGIGDQGQRPDQEEGDYKTDVMGQHAPYGYNPDGGEPNPPPEEDHLHTIDFGKAESFTVSRPRAKRRPFFVEVEPGTLGGVL